MNPNLVRRAEARKRKGTRYWYHPESDALFSTNDGKRINEPLVEELSEAEYREIKDRQSRFRTLEDISSRLGYLRRDNTPGSHVDAWQVLELLDDLVLNLLTKERKK